MYKNYYLYNVSWKILLSNRRAKIQTKEMCSLKVLWKYKHNQKCQMKDYDWLKRSFRPIVLEKSILIGS